MQADQRFRSEAKDIAQYYLRSDTGKMIPLDHLVTIEQTANPQVISHYNLFRAAEIDGSGAPGRSSGEAMAAMEPLARKVLPNGMTFDWTGLSLEELESGGKAAILFALGLTFVYLTLAANTRVSCCRLSCCSRFPLRCWVLSEARRSSANEASPFVCRRCH